MYDNRQIKRGGLPVMRKGFSPAARSHKSEEAPLLKTVFLSSLIGVAVNAVAGTVLLCAVCFVALSSKDPLSLMAPLALLALFPANFLGGFVSSKRTGESPFACGILTAAIWCVVSLALSLCFVGVRSSNYATWQSLVLHAASVLFCLLGAFAGNYKSKRTHKKRRFG